MWIHIRILTPVPSIILERGAYVIKFLLNNKNELKIFGFCNVIFSISEKYPLFALQRGGYGGEFADK
jgi:hypothetical protein